PVDLLQVGRRRHPVLIDRLLGLLAQVPLLRLVIVARDRAVDRPATGAVVGVGGLRRGKPALQPLVLPLQRRDPGVLLGQRALAAGQLLGAAAQVLAQAGDRRGLLGLRAQPAAEA